MSPTELKELMRHNNMDVKQLANIIEVSVNCVYKWLQGTRKIGKLAEKVIKSELGEW